MARQVRISFVLISQEQKIYAMRRILIIAAWLVISGAAVVVSEIHPLPRFEYRLERLAGLGAIDCGLIKPRADTTASSRCVLDAFADHKPFYVIYDVQEFRIELYFIDGVAGDAAGNVYDVEYGSRGWSSEDVGAGVRSQLFDSGKIFAESCPKPVVLTKSVYGGLTCLPRLTKRDNVD